MPPDPVYAIIRHLKLVPIAQGVAPSLVPWYRVVIVSLDGQFIPSIPVDSRCQHATVGSTISLLSPDFRFHPRTPLDPPDIVGYWA